MALLDGLDRVDWRRYHHAYGPAVDVPDLLRALADDGRASAKVRAAARRLEGDDAVFEAVTWELWGNVFHQGSVWGVTAKVVPFLAELLAAGLPAPRRRFLVTYLHHLARGYPTDVFPLRFDVEGLLAACAEVDALGLPQSVLDGDAFGALPRGVRADDARRATLVWVRDSYLAVEAALPAVRARFDDDDDEVVREAIACAASFHREARASIEPLWHVARRSPTAPSSAAALVALAQLGAEGVVEAARATASNADPASPRAAWAAAAAILASPEGGASWAQRVILEAPAAWAEVPCAFAGTVGNLANRLLVGLPAEARLEAVASVGRNLARERGFGKLDAAAALLALARIDDPRALDAVQREVVRLLAEHGDWPDGSTNGNQASMLRGAGLPTTRAGLRDLLTSS